MDRTSFRKPRQHFETASNPSHVAFDDGRAMIRILPWMHLVEVRWEYAEPETVRVVIGETLILLTGHNLAPLLSALKERALAEVRAQPELLRNPDREGDSFVTQIDFAKPLKPSAQGKGDSSQLDLGLG